MKKALSSLALLLWPVILVIFTVPFLVFAQNFVPLSGKGVSGVDLAPYMTRAFSGSGKLGDFVNAMFKSALAVGAMLAVLQLARAGFYYMGSDVWAKKEQGKQIMRDAVVGLLILLAIWLILSQINPQLLNLDVLSRISKVSLPAPVTPTPKQPPTPLPLVGKVCAKISQAPTLGTSFDCSYKDVDSCRRSTTVAVATCVQRQGTDELKVVSKSAASGVCAPSLSQLNSYVCGFKDQQECYTLSTAVDTASLSCSVF